MPNTFDAHTLGTLDPGGRMYYYSLSGFFVIPPK